MQATPRRPPTPSNGKHSGDVEKIDNTPGVAADRICLYSSPSRVNIGNSPPDNTLKLAIRLVPNIRRRTWQNQLAEAVSLPSILDESAITAAQPVK